MRYVNAFDRYHANVMPDDRILRDTGELRWIWQQLREWLREHDGGYGDPVTQPIWDIYADLNWYLDILPGIEEEARG